MATGYDNRQPTRSSFAFNPAAPVQSRSAPSGQSRGAQVVGGRSQGQAVVAGPQTDAAPVAGQLGEYFGELMQPYIQRKQTEQFFKGYAEAQSGKAIEEIGSSGKGIARIFGPTGFQQGAEFYTAQTKLNEFASEVMEDMDNIKRLPPAEAAKLLTDKSRELMTGDPFANQLIQQGLIERMGPVLNTVAKARFAYGQETAVKKASEAWATSATLLQQTMKVQGTLSDPTDESRMAAATAMQGFLSGMAKPEGMTDESYQGLVADFMRNAAQAGNGYAVEAMYRAGVDKVLTEDQRTKLEDSRLRYGTRAIGDAAMGQSEALINLDTLIKTEGISALDAAAELHRINEVLKAETGFDIDLFDHEDINNAAGSVTDALVASYRRAETRRWQLEDRNQDRAWKKEDEAAEEARVAAQVSAAWGSGDVETAVAAGMSRGDFDLLASNDLNAGNYTRIANAFAVGGTVSKLAQTQMQAAVTSAIGEGYTDDMKRAYGQWKALNGIKAGAAAAYYGKYHPMMQAFDTLMNRGYKPNAAYTRAFGDPRRYAPVEIPRERRKEADTAIGEAVDGMAASWYQFGAPADLNASGRAVAVGMLRDAVGVATQNTDLPTALIVKQQVEALQADGSLERVGAFAWRNASGTTPLHRIVGMQPKEFEATFTEVVDRKLKAAGFTDGAGGDNYDIVRIKTPSGGHSVHIIATPDDGGASTDVYFDTKDIVALHEYRMDERAVRTKGKSNAPDAFKRMQSSPLNPNRK